MSRDSFPADKQPAIRRVMMPRDTNALGTIFGGVILSEIDSAAAIEAHRYHPRRIVTIAMDKIEFHQPVFVGDLVSFFCECTRIGRTSITVQVEVWAQRARDRAQRSYVTAASVTMVAVDDAFRPIPIEHREPVG
jgi:acyl-CoA thioesterase YciA